MQVSICKKQLESDEFLKTALSIIAVSQTFLEDEFLNRKCKESNITLYLNPTNPRPIEKYLEIQERCHNIQIQMSQLSITSQCLQLDMRTFFEEVYTLAVVCNHVIEKFKTSHNQKPYLQFEDKFNLKESGGLIEIQNNLRVWIFDYNSRVDLSFRRIHAEKSWGFWYSIGVPDSYKDN